MKRIVAVFVIATLLLPSLTGADVLVAKGTWTSLIEASNESGTWEYESEWEDTILVLDYTYNPSTGTVKDNSLHFVDYWKEGANKYYSLWSIHPDHVSIGIAAPEGGKAPRKVIIVIDQHWETPAAKAAVETGQFQCLIWGALTAKGLDNLTGHGTIIGRADGTLTELEAISQELTRLPDYTSLQDVIDALEGRGFVPESD
jgi:hypothetical protein